MTVDGFLVATVVAAVVAMVMAGLVAAHLPPVVPRPGDQAHAVDPAWPPSALAVSVVYRAAIARARQQSTGRLLATHWALAHRAALSADELVEWAATHHVLIAERGIAHTGDHP